MSCSPATVPGKVALSRRSRAFLVVHYSAIAGLLLWIGYLFLNP